ncbi:hypothetical protein EP7_005359 [Isosphaeraceae bacterium EP7]
MPGSLRIALSLSLALLGTVGCGSNHGCVPVGGTVTYKGKPVAEGEVSFVPVEGDGRTGRGEISSAGVYQLTSFDPGDGVVPGKYKVSVVSRGPDKPIPAKKKGRMMEEDMQGSGDPLIPAKYFMPETSGLEREVEAAKTNTFNFELTD